MNNKRQFSSTLLGAVPGILIWWCAVGYLLDGLTWPGPVLLGVLIGGSLVAGYFTTRYFVWPDLHVVVHSFKVAWIRASLFFGVILLVAGWLASFLPTLSYPANHSLLICAPAKGDYDRTNSPFLIRSIKYDSGISLPILDLQGNEPWNYTTDGLLAQAGGACANFSAFFKGGLTVDLREGPGAGQALIEWDGVSELLNLDADSEGVRTIQLAGDHPLSPPILRLALGFSFRTALAVTLLVGSFALAMALTTGKWGSGPLDADNIWLVLGSLAMLGILASANLGRNAALAADDFCYSGVAQNAGILNGTWQFYTGVNGRLLGNFIGLVIGSLFPVTQPAYLVFLVLVLWVSSLWPLVASTLRWLAAKPLNGVAWVLSALVVLVTMINTPDVFQSVFWRSGREPLLFPLMLLPSLLVHISDLAGKPSNVPFWVRLLFILLLALCAGAFHEAFAAAQLAMLIVGGLLVVLDNKQVYKTNRRLVQTLLVATLGAVLGLLVHIVSPGTAERSTVLGVQFRLWDILYGALYDSSVFLFAQNLNILTISLFVLGVIVAVRTSRPNIYAAENNGTIVWFGFPLIVWSGVAASFAVSHYGLGGTLPGRTQVIPTFFGILGSLIWGVISGTVLLKHAAKLVQEQWHKPALILVTSILGIALVFYGYAVTKQKPAFEHYGRAVNVMVGSIDAARMRGVNYVVVSQLPENPYQVTGPGADEPNFVNSCVNDLFTMNVGFEE